MSDRDDSDPRGRPGRSGGHAAQARPRVAAARAASRCCRPTPRSSSRRASTTTTARPAARAPRARPARPRVAAGRTPTTRRASSSSPARCSPSASPRSPASRCSSSAPPRGERPAPRGRPGSRRRAASRGATQIADARRPRVPRRTRRAARRRRRPTAWPSRASPLTVALRQSADQGGNIQVHDEQGRRSTSSAAWAPNCAIDRGKPSHRARFLLRREALELALYSFRYLGRQAGRRALPPRPGKAQTVALYFRRGDVARRARPAADRLAGARGADASRTSRSRPTPRSWTRPRTSPYLFTLHGLELQRPRLPGARALHAAADKKLQKPSSPSRRRRQPTRRRPARAVESAARGKLARAKARLDTLDLYPRPVRMRRVRLVSAPWLFRLPWFRRFDGYTMWDLILLRARRRRRARRPRHPRALPRLADAAPPGGDAAVLPVPRLQRQPQRGRGAARRRRDALRAVRRAACTSASCGTRPRRRSSRSRRARAGPSRALRASTRASPVARSRRATSRGP